MASKPSTNKRVTLERFNKFLEAKAPERPCPECGTNDWTVFNRIGTELEGDRSTLQRVYLPASLAGHPGFAVHPVYCPNCGYVKLFKAEIVGEWINANG